MHLKNQRDFKINEENKSKNGELIAKLEETLRSKTNLPDDVCNVLQLNLDQQQKERMINQEGNKNKVNRIN